MGCCVSKGAQEVFIVSAGGCCTQQGSYTAAGLR